MTTSTTHVLSIDVGTSSIRSKIFDHVGSEIEGLGVQIPYEMHQTNDGGCFIDADALCVLISQAIDAAVNDAQSRAISIDAVAMCTFWHNVVGVDQAGNACTPLINWSDTRPEAILPELRELIDPHEFTQRTGCPFHAAYLPAKIFWYKQTHSERFKQVQHWMSIGEYFYYRVTGKRHCSFSMASGSGMLQSNQLQWDAQILSALGLQTEQLSELVNGNEGQPCQQDPYAKRWAYLKDAQWYPAYGDGACSNIGCGAVSPEHIAIMVGTSGAMRVVWRGEYTPPAEGLWCYRIDQHRVIQGGALSNGGNIAAWMRDNLYLPTLEELDQQLLARQPDCHGLVFLPFLAGQRSPRWNPNSRGTIHGLRISTTSLDILQAGMEAIAYRFRLIHERLASHYPQDHIVVATGGGLINSKAWTQIMSDCLGRPVQQSLVSEASCRGAALMALESLGVIPDITAQEKNLGKLVEPRPSAIGIYSQAFKRHVDFEMTHNFNEK